jgi:AhpC/TSA family
MIGIFGLVLVIAASIYQFARNGVGSPGIAPGQRLHYFVAPLATGSLNGDANLNPRCDPARPNPHALNVCGRAPLVLAFFVTGSASCRGEVNTLQAVSRRFAPGTIQFAAVAVRGGRSQTAALVRSHRWAIPVAYDRDGAVGETYGVEICPMVELAYRGGIVADRLIGEHWLSEPALLARVRRLLSR